jgi:hypothetical protein
VEDSRDRDKITLTYLAFIKSIVIFYTSEDVNRANSSPGSRDLSTPPPQTAEAKYANETHRLRLRSNEIYNLFSYSYNNGENKAIPRPVVRGLIETLMYFGMKGVRHINKDPDSDDILPHEVKTDKRIIDNITNSIFAYSSLIRHKFQREVNAEKKFVEDLNLSAHEMEHDSLKNGNVPATNSPGVTNDEFWAWQFRNAARLFTVLEIYIVDLFITLPQIIAHPFYVDMLDSHGSVGSILRSYSTGSSVAGPPSWMLHTSTSGSAAAKIPSLSVTNADNVTEEYGCEIPESVDSSQSSLRSGPPSPTLSAYNNSRTIFPNRSSRALGTFIGLQRFLPLIQARDDNESPLSEAAVWLLACQLPHYPYNSLEKRKLGTLQTTWPTWVSLFDAKVDGWSMSNWEGRCVKYPGTAKLKCFNI